MPIPDWFFWLDFWATWALLCLFVFHLHSEHSGKKRAR